jgi:WD40 repeat protein
VEEKDLTCCARSLLYKNVIVAGDRYSKLKLFNYPTPYNKVFNKYEGHSNAVTTIMFNEKEDYLISVGGEEKAIFIWKYDPVLIKNSYVLDVA